MSPIYSFSIILGILAFFASFAAAEDYSIHPVAIRMQYLDNLLTNYNNLHVYSQSYVNQNDDEEIEYEIAFFIRNEIEQNTPSFSQNSSHSIVNHQGEYPQVNYGESMIAMLKLLATLHQRYLLNYSNKFNYKYIQIDEFWKLYTNAMKELATSSTVNPATELKNNQDLAEYVLDWHTYIQLLDVLGEYQHPERNDMDWISYVLMLAIENSSHMKQSFSKGMLRELNIVRNKANAVNLKRLIEESNIDDFVVAFPFEKFMIDMDLSTRNKSDVQNTAAQLKRTLVEETTEYSLKTQMRYKMLEVQKRGAAIAYSALLELPIQELTEYLDEIAYAFKLRDLSFESELINRLHSFLTNRTTDPDVFDHRSQLDERLSDFEYLFANFENFFRNETRSDAKYLDYATIAFRIINKGTSRVASDDIKSLFYRLGRRMLQPDIFDDPIELAQYDRNHISLYKADDFEFYYMHSPISNDYIANYSIRADELLNTITSASSDESFNIRNQIRVLLRIGIHMSNLRNKARGGIAGLEIYIEKFASTYINLMKRGADVFAKDPMLMDEWYQFTFNFPKQVSKAFDNNTIEMLAQHTESGDSEAEAVFYIFLVRTANFLTAIDRTNDAENLLTSIMKLEEAVDYAETKPGFIQMHVLREKQLFYILYSNQAAAYFTDLTKLVEHHIELFTSLTFWYREELRQLLGYKYDVDDLAKLKLLDAIYTVASKGSDAENHLIDSNGQLALKVNQLTNDLNHKNEIPEELAEKVLKCEHLFGRMT